MTERSKSFTPYWEEVRTFLDFVTILADYAAAAAVTGVLRHTGGAFCTHFSIPKRRTGRVNSIIYTTSCHSRSLGYMRFDERSRVLRSDVFPKELRRLIGMKGESEKKSCRIPLVRFAHVLATQRHKGIEDINGYPAHRNLFDFTQSIVIVPDHLKLALTRNVMSLCFRVIALNEERRGIEILILDALHTKS